MVCGDESGSKGYFRIKSNLSAAVAECSSIYKLFPYRIKFLKDSQAPLPGKVAALLRESKWFALIALAAVRFAPVLITFSKGDPGWSDASSSDQIHNAGGRAGAWIADLLLSGFPLIGGCCC